MTSFDLGEKTQERPLAKLYEQDSEHYKVQYHTKNRHSNTRNTSQITQLLQSDLGQSVAMIDVTKLALSSSVELV